VSDSDPPGARPNLATGVAGLLVSLGAVGFALADPTELVSTLTLVLVVTATVAELISARYASRYVVSGAFLCGVLAIAFVGPTAGFAVPVIAISVAWVFERYRWRALLITLAGAGPPTMAIGFVFEALSLDSDSTGFLAALAVAGLVVFACSVFVVVPLMAVLDGQPILSSLRGFVGIAPTVAINIAALVFLAGIYRDVGLSALAFVLLLIVAFSYMARLVAEARARTREYASLSWGVLSGLIRTLDERDSRAARHCAAVAAFSRDIAKHVGCSTRDQELAHTAGLLHDIGKFALSDRVMERGARLEDADWRGIRRHPEIGADLLKDIGVYGPIADIIRAHHERLDGRGYPNGLRGEEIPLIAKIVAVAEVYDTLTAPDTYRTPMNSFEALNELRRVSGTQLDGTYVEALAALLAGRGTDYRHADEADFDRELDMERRITEATTAGPA
jgi:putative nucleotidyltransferase with HDIG domain